MRRLLYQLASLLGWLNAIQRGRLPQRVVRVTALKKFSALLNKVLK